MKKALFILMTLLLTSALFAEDPIINFDPDDSLILDFDHYIGGTAGFSTGYGLTYRYWPENLGAQITFAPYWSGETVDMNVGITGFNTLYETRYTRLFLYLAGSYYYHYSKYDQEIWDDDYENVISTETIIDESHNIVIGAGPGFEVFLFKNIAVDGMFGYRWSLQDGVTFTAEGGIYYRF